MAEFLLEAHPESEVELLKSIQWYADRNAEVAEAFEHALERAGEMIIRAPHIWPTHSRGTHKHRVKGFPFKIIYRIIGNVVQVVAVAHDRRRPQYWLERLH